MIYFENRILKVILDNFNVGGIRVYFEKYIKWFRCIGLWILMVIREYDFLL